MANIKVDPIILNNSAMSVTGSASGITGAGNNANGAANSAPSYDGQFGPKVKAIGSQAVSMGHNTTLRLNDHSSFLLNKSTVFSAVDGSGFSGSSSTASLLPFLFGNPLFFALLPDSIKKAILQMLLLGNLSFLGTLSQDRTTGQVLGATTDGQVLGATTKTKYSIFDSLLLYKTGILTKSSLSFNIFTTFPWLHLPWINNNLSENSTEPISRTPFTSIFTLPVKNYKRFGDIGFRETYSSSNVRGGDVHPGVDILTKAGEAVFPVADGKVIRAKYDEGGANGYGNYIVVEHQLPNEKVYSLYAHLTDDSIKDIIDKDVTTNDVIGSVGNSGNWGNTYHVHLEIRHEAGRDKQYPDAKLDNWSDYFIDPLEVINNNNFKY